MQFKYLMVFLPHVRYLPVWAKGLRSSGITTEHPLDVNWANLVPDTIQHLMSAHLKKKQKKQNKTKKAEKEISKLGPLVYVYLKRNMNCWKA